LYYFHKNLQKTQNTILVGFFMWVFLGIFGWVFLGGFFWLGFFIGNPAQVALGGLALLAWSEDLSYDSRPRYEQVVLLIRDAYPGSEFLHSGFEFFSSRIRIKEFKPFNAKASF
jgi:hypothetical protein